ncbi:MULTISPECIES: 2-oxo-4-hydroxy-4-carboxy-5-ureidoimidazoline decarboxylase [Nocardiaceae]|uniref:2-oxo-4-hydroxy-4-carboxy-5-ureidoimidazoline decarboxylase n=1 Tax=Rhodococcoides corynebacterioides TaxID=53972 RepID=A0ABS2KSR3_9NOCA|nr:MULTISPECIES: 2-oxo-4-hydroxy-4-carboxy-5-ureidoimidazoline decarboxylase [Rhodococcus]MBM7414982.1 2-oxo-4-hydroxy-4-carboxy-5-ureidoimidazoline decarboxylase [Rhodococcus corynebacterioides]MBP1117444.1 2-oxo-4-hydroxy-4-carboxy-5-ureidoimidazoline decarboxylase [Rhodococcus sp. PvP016]
MELLFRDTESKTLAGDGGEEHLRHCLDIPRWGRALLALRPFADENSLHTAVMSVAAPFTPAEIDGALRHHPRIGDRPVGDDAGAAFARSEQSGVDSSDARVGARLAAGNEEYESRFGRVFLVRAAGRSAADVLAELDRRLGHDESTELREIEEALRQIAAVRLLGPGVL